MRDIDTLARKSRAVMFVGNEAFFKEEGLRAHMKEMRKWSLDEEHFDGSGKMRHIEEALNEYPLLGKYRLVVCRDLDEVTNFEKLASWLKDPLEAVFWAVTFSDELADVPAVFNDVHLKVVCNDMGPDSKDFAKYLEFCLEGTGKHLAVDAAEKVTRTFAANLAMVKFELFKAAMYIGERPTITLEDVDAVIGDYPMNEIFALVDACIMRDVKKAMTLVNSLESRGTEAGKIIHIITQRLLLLQGAYSAQQRGERLKDWLIRKKHPLFLAGAVIDGLKSLRSRTISRFYDVLAEGEMRIKHFEDPRVVLEGIVLDLCH